MKKPTRPRAARDYQSPAKATPAHGDLCVDDPDNWDFARVPREEREACCRWEYARESAFIRDLQRQGADRARMPQPDWNNPPDVAKWRKRVFAFASDLQRLKDRGVFESNLAAELTCPLAEQRFPRPWLALSPAERKARIVSPATTVPAFERGNYAQAGHIFAQAEAMSFPAAGGWKVAPSSYLADSAEVGVFRIGWDHWTEKEIKLAFARWVDKNRPPQFRKPKGRPPGAIDPEAALHSLGIMRVLHAHTLHDLAFKFEKLNTRKPQRDRERALEYFQKFSPIGTAEVPLSWPMLDK